MGAPPTQQAAMPLMSTIPKPWPSDIGGAPDHCVANAAAPSSPQGQQTRVLHPFRILLGSHMMGHVRGVFPRPTLRTLTIGVGWFLISELGLHVLRAIPICFLHALPPPPVSKAVAGRSPIGSCNFANSLCTDWKGLTGLPNVRI